MTDEQYLSTKQAADLLGTTDRTIRNWIKSGRLRATRQDPDDTTSPFLIPTAEVQAILDKRKRQLENPS